MAISLDAVSKSSVGASVSSLTWAHTVGSGSNKKLSVQVQARDAGLTDFVISGVTFNGVALTEVRTDQYTAGGSDGGQMKTGIWEIRNPASTTANIVVTFAGTVNHASAHAISLFGVDQSAAYDARTGNNAATSTPSVNITTVANNAWVVDSVYSKVGGDLSVGGGQTGISTQNGVNGGGDRAWASYEGPKTPAGSVTMSYTHAGTDDYCMSVVSYAPAGGTAYDATLTETVTIVDTVIKTPARTLSDVVTLVDTVLRTTSRTLSDPITIVDTVIKTPGKVLSDVVTVVDTVIKTSNKVLTDTVTVVDSVIKTASRTFSETVTVVDSVLKIGQKVLTEAVTVVDVFTGTKVTVKTLLETIKIYDQDEILKDDFGEATLNSMWTNWGGARVTISSGTLRIASTTSSNYYGVDLSVMSFANKTVQIHIPNAGNQAIVSWGIWPLYLKFDSDNNLNWSIQNGTIRATKKIAGSDTNIYETTYDDAVHVYLRIREESGTVYWDSSADGETWTNRASSATPFSLASITCQVFVGTYQAEVSTTNANFDDFLVRNSYRGALITLSRSLTDSIPLVDTITRVASRTLTDAVTIVDTVEKTIARTLSDTITLVDTVIKTASRTFSETFTVSDIFERVIARTLSDAVTVQDTITRTISRTLTDSIAIVDVINRTISHTLTDTITVIDTIERTISKVLTDTVTVVDTFTSGLAAKITAIPTYLYSKFQGSFLSPKRKKLILQSKKKTGFK